MAKSTKTKKTPVTPYSLSNSPFVKDPIAFAVITILIMILVSHLINPIETLKELLTQVAQSTIIYVVLTVLLKKFGFKYKKK